MRVRCGLALTCLPVLLAGCGAAPARVDLEAAVGVEYGRLYVRQQTLLDRTGFQLRDVLATASCERGGPDVADRGAGDDWTCSVGFTSVDGAAGRVTYELTVAADGCYRADGPPGVVGQQLLRLPGGGTATNPLYGFDGCGLEPRAGG